MTRPAADDGMCMPTPELVGDTAYDAAPAALDRFGLVTERNEQAAEAFEAQLTTHDFHRDPQLAEQIRELRQAVGQARAHTASARQVLASHHAAGGEYHSSGRDADAAAFRTHGGRGALPGAGPVSGTDPEGIPAGRTERADPVDEILAAGSYVLPVTLATRQILHLAIDAGLKPGLGSGPYRGSYRVVVDSGGRRDCLFGGIDIGTRTGRILRAYLTNGHWGEERRYDHVADIRRVLKSWAALQQSAAHD